MSVGAKKTALLVKECAEGFEHVKAVQKCVSGPRVMRVVKTRERGWEWVRRFQNTCKGSGSVQGR